MFQFGDLFKGGFSFMNQQPALEDKLSNQNLPLEDFLKDDEAVSTIKFMGKNTKKYLNSEKIKQLIKLITEEPKIDDQLHGHKFPYVAFQILKSDCPFIAKRFVLNEQEYHEEYPDSPEDEIDELGLDLDIENENENKEIEFDFKKNKIEFEKIYQQIEENFRNIRKSISEDKEEKRSKDDSERDVYKTDNNNYEEEYEEYEDIKEDNVIDDINTDDNTNEKNSEDIEEEKEKEEELKDNELNDIEDDNINKKDNIGNENNEEKNCAKTKENKEEEKQEGNNEVDIEKDNIEENKEANIEKLDNKKDEEKEEKNKAETKKINNEETLDKNDVKIEENNNEENKEKNDVETVKNKKEENIEKEVTKENNNDGEEIKDKNETKEINNNNILNEENQESIDNKEKKDDANKENKDSIENKKDNVEDNKQNNDIKNENIDNKKEIIEDNNKDKIISEEKIETNKDNQEKENNKENKKVENELNNEENKKEAEPEIKEEKKEEKNEEEKIKTETKEESKDDHKNDTKEEIKKEIDNNIQESNKINEQKIEENNEEKINNEEANEKQKEEKNENLEEENKTELKEEKSETENTEEKNNTESKEEKIEDLKKEENEDNTSNEKKDENIDNKENDKFNSKNNQENDEHLKEKQTETFQEIKQLEEENEEINNIIIDKAEEEKEKEKEKNIIANQDNENIDNIDYDQENSLSVEGELDEEIKKKNNKKKKVYKNSEKNEFFDLLLNFVMTDKPELNYVLAGYFANVIITLLNAYPYKIIKYLYTQRKDALKKILFHSNQKAFAILSSKLLNIESYMKTSDQNQELNEFIIENIPYRNELIKEIINSINLDGLNQHPADAGGENCQNTGVDIEAIFSLISGLIDENKLIVKELIDNNYLCPHLFDILDTDLYSDLDNNKENFDENKFNIRYNIYGLFIDLISKFVNIINTTYNAYMPTDFNFENLLKPKTDLKFNENVIISFGKIIKNNFIAKKPPFIVEKMSNIKYEGLGSLNLKIFDLIKNMFFFMRELPKQFDMLLIRNNFCQRSIEYFFKYQWNNIYQNKFIEFFNLYLTNEEKHEELTNYYFKHLKLQNLLMNFFDENSNENESNMTQKIQFEFKNGNKIKSGIYPHVIDIIYKINTFSGTDIFSEEEKKQLKIINLGEFEFSKDEKSNKFPKPLIIKNNLKEIFSQDEKWNSIFKNKVLPVIKKYEGQLCPKKPIDDDEPDIKSDYGANNLLFQQMLNIIKRNNPIKRTSLPISRNDKNSTNNTSLNKEKKDKFSIREKLLSKGYKGRHIFDDEDDDDKKEKAEENNYKNNDEEENLDEKDKMFNDTNYWEKKNELPEKIKKEVDKKTNIIFNYNPITGENEKNNEISEEDELLSIAMGLEQNEKMEKNKKVMYMLPGKLKPINLKTKSNPVQNIFINIGNKNKNNKLEKIKNIKKDIINIFENEMNNQNEEHENEEENIIKKEEENIEENNINKNESENDKMFNDVNYWKSNNLVKEEEMENLINDL